MHRAFIMYFIWDWRHHSRDMFLPSFNIRFFFRFLSRDWWWTSSDLWAEQDLLLLWLLHFFHLCTFGFEDDWCEEDHAACEEDPRWGADKFVQRADTNDRGIGDGLGEIAHRLRKHFCQAPETFRKGLIWLILIIIAMLLFVLKTQLGYFSFKENQLNAEYIYGSSFWSLVLRWHYGFHSRIALFNLKQLTVHSSKLKN